MKAIILAAGRGSRMGPLTDEGPKGLLRIGQGTLLERTVKMLRDAGVCDIVITRGYMADRVIVEGATYVENVDWSSTDVLHSIFAAKDHLQGDVLISYSDIVFTNEVLLTAIASPDHIGPVVDLDWRPAYEGRFWHPLAEADKVVLRGDGTIAQIGKVKIRHEDADGEFIGMLRLSGDGAARLVEAYDASARLPDAPFKRAATFRRAYLTDLLQQMIDDGERLMPTVIRGGWREIDTKEDLDRTRRWLDARSR